MSGAGRSLLRRAAAACLALLAASPARAQLSPPPAPQPPSAPQFMSRFDFHMSASALATGDARFDWDTHFGGDFDFVDYVRGRATFLADYQAVLGGEFRAFDPNQGNYTLEAAGSVRTRPAELFLVLHHISRHLGDRPNTAAIAWNILQIRALRRLTAGNTTIDLRADLGKVIAHAGVDYSWKADLDVLLRRPTGASLGTYARGYLETLGIDGDLSRRGQQTGVRLEGGLRLPGPGGAFDLFVGYERVVDADAFERLPLHWAFAGFRLATR
jgi:hypothetical protein